jgi:uncharacterized protein YndB with AHSA1/START domain/effector-binding domain-containing protein
MPSLRIRKTVVIQAPMDRVYATIRDFDQWPRWSPWLICEPDAQVTFRGDGRGYAWDGQVVGSGRIEIDQEQPPQSIAMRISFLKPFKSQSGVGFTLREVEGGKGTEVIWSMNGSLPFFLFFLKGLMTGMLGSDYERGLQMLQAYVETGSVPSKLDFAGRGSFAGGRYVGIRVRVEIANVGPSMEEAFAKLEEWASRHGVARAGQPISIYHKWDFATGMGEYTSAVKVDESASLPGLPPGGVEVRIPACSVETVRHTGPYSFLGNPWAAAMTRSRALKWSVKRGMDPFEVYVNEPGTVPETELITEVHIPVK